MPRQTPALTLQEQIGSFVNDGFIKLLREAFPYVRPTPKSTRDSDLWGSAQQALIDYLEECSSQAKDLPHDV